MERITDFASSMSLLLPATLLGPLPHFAVGEAGLGGGSDLPKDTCVRRGQPGVAAPCELMSDFRLDLGV